MSEPRVAVVQPAFSQDATKAKLPNSECLSLGYLVAALRQEGLDATPLDADLLDIPNDACIDQLVAGGFDIVGISCSAQRAYPDAVQVARSLKERSPDTHVTVGGQFISHVHETVAASEPAFDSIVRGEGERTFPALVRRVHTDTSLAGLRGVTFRHGNEVVVNPPADRITDLDRLPFPDRRYVPHILTEALAGVRYVSMIGTRGCIYKCTFCSVDRPRAVRSPANVVAELRALHDRWGLWKFMFNDDLLIGAAPDMQAWGEELADLIASEFPGLEFWAMTRSDAVNTALFSKLRRAGFSKIFIGVESASDDVLKRLKKGTRAPTNDRAIRVLEDVGIEPELGFIMLEPHMSWDDLRQNLAFLRRVGHFSRHNLTNRLNIYHGAPLYQTALDDGDITPTDDVIERYLYEFEDERVRVYSELMTELKRHGFGTKVQVTDAVTGVKLYQAELARSLGPDSRTDPSVIALRDEARRLERAEADAWLRIFELAYDGIEHKSEHTDLLDGLLPHVDLLLAGVADAARQLEARVDEARLTPAVTR
jgi:radical SAM superfamily enzyme YgiQ (UPF0313 family)